MADRQDTGAGMPEVQLIPGPFCPTLADAQHLANIVVLSENMLRVGPTRLMKPRVEMIIVGGMARYRHM